jgi:glycosyltransferase involved in cell wall biosynthesis
VRRIYNCAGEGFFAAPVPRRDGSGLHLATVGRLVEVKNHAGLIRAFAEAARARPGLRLTIVGDGPLRGALEEQVGATGVSDRIRLPGFRSDIRAFLDSVDAFVLPSFSEGFGIALVEAMARGLPVLASTAGALPELMGSKAAEWAADPHDEAAWSRMIGRFADVSAAERVALGEWARERAGRFSPRAHIDAVENLYEELLRSKRKDLR